MAFKKQIVDRDAYEEARREERKRMSRRLDLLETWAKKVSEKLGIPLPQ